MTRGLLPAMRARWRKAVATASVTALAAGTAIAVGAPTAQAAPTTFNPFDANNGFTIVSQGDVELGNGELEGSVAAFGSISSDRQNYPVVHHAVGRADYQVPHIDDVPVRILANEFVGTGNFDVTNAGHLGEETPEAQAIAKLVDTSNIEPRERGDFVRLHNDQVSDSEAGNIDLKALKWTAYEGSEYKTVQSSVASYFPDMGQQLEQTSKCLASMYEGDLVNTVTVVDEGGMVYPEGFVTDRPNVINYSDIAGQIIKTDNMDGYRPTAESPLVVRVDNDTATIGKLNFEGWSAGDNQELARYIFLDLSAVTGSVTIDGLEAGAVWAPNADLSFNSGTTTNGMWFSKSFSSGPGAGELHHHDFLGKLPCGDDPVAPGDPEIGTTVAVAGSGDKVLPLTGGTVVDSVAYKNLTAGQEYTLKGEVHTSPAGVATGITAEAMFTPDSTDGTTTVTFEISAAEVAQYAGKDLVVYEYLYLDGERVTEHTDPTDEAQTFTVEKKVVTPGDPKIGTTVAVDGSDDKVLPLTGGTVVDTVAYEGLEPGETYELRGQVRTSPEGDETGIEATATFTPSSADGTTTVTFEISAEDVAEYAGQDLVVYEYLYLDGERVTEHTDPTDAAQTFTVEKKVVTPGDPNIGTTVSVEGSDDKVLPLTGGTVVDTVAYEGLTAGQEYTLKGEVRTSPAGLATGLTAEATFTPDSTDGTTEVTFELSAAQVKQYAGQDLVVYEYLYLDDELVAQHTDPRDEAQIFTVEDEDPCVPCAPGTGSVDLGSLAVGSLGLGSLGLGSLGSSGGSNSGGSNGSTGSIPSGSIDVGSDVGSTIDLGSTNVGGSVGSTGPGSVAPVGSLGSLAPVGSLGSLAALGSLGSQGGGGSNESGSGSGVGSLPIGSIEGGSGESVDPSGSAGSTGPGSVAPVGSVGSVAPVGSVGSLAPIGSLGSLAPVGSLGSLAALGSLGSQGGGGSNESGSGSGVGSLPIGSIEGGSGESVDPSGSAGSTGPGSVAPVGSVGSVAPVGSVGSLAPIGSLGSLAPVGSLGSLAALGSLGSQGGGGSNESGSGSGVGSLPIGSIEGGSGESVDPSGSAGSTELGSLGSLAPVGSLGSLAPAGSLAPLGSLGSLAPVGSLALAAGSLGDSSSQGNGSGTPGAPEAPAPGEPSTPGDSSPTGESPAVSAATGGGATNGGGATSAVSSGKGGRIDAGLGAGFDSTGPQVLAGLALLALAGGALYAVIRSRGAASDDS